MNLYYLRLDQSIVLPEDTSKIIKLSQTKPPIPLAINVASYLNPFQHHPK